MNNDEELRARKALGQGWRLSRISAKGVTMYRGQLDTRPGAAGPQEQIDAASMWALLDAIDDFQRDRRGQWLGSVGASEPWRDELRM